jgi:hypothetical protein
VLAKYSQVVQHRPLPGTKRSRCLRDYRGIQARWCRLWVSPLRREPTPRWAMPTRPLNVRCMACADTVAAPAIATWLTHRKPSAAARRLISQYEVNNSQLISECPFPESEQGMGQIMKVVAALVSTATVAIAAAGCGAGQHTPPPVTTAAASRPATSAASPAASPVSAATANERSLADGLAESIPAMPVTAVAGTLMRAYVRFQHAYGGPWVLSGSPFPARR